MCGRTVTLILQVSAKPCRDHELHAYLKTLSRRIRSVCFITSVRFAETLVMYADKYVKFIRCYVIYIAGGEEAEGV